MSDLLRPPPHRGPLIAAGAVLLAVGVAQVQFRVSGEAWLFVSAALLAAVCLGLGLQVRNDQGAPYAFQSVLLVVGLLAFATVLWRGGAWAGADPFEETWAAVAASLLLGAMALTASLVRESAACLLIAAVAGVSALLNLWELVFSPDSTTPFRWLLLLCAAVFVLLALLTRGSRYRHSVQLVNAAGLSVAAICLTFAALGFFFGIGAGTGSGLGWELVALACGCGLIAFGAVDRQPGPALLGMLVLALFVSMVGVEEDTLVGWPLFLLVLGTIVFGAGLRPRRPLPPEPDAYRSGDLPLAARSVDDTTVTSVRVD